MKILFDQGSPLQLRVQLHSHQVDSAAEQCWSELKNGDLLDEAEACGYEALITTDQQIRHQQRLAGRRMRIIVLMTTSWPGIRRKTQYCCDKAYRGPNNYRVRGESAPASTVVFA